MSDEIIYCNHIKSIVIECVSLLSKKKVMNDSFPSGQNKSDHCYDQLEPEAHW